MAHPLAGRKKSRQHKDRIRATQLARYARLREAARVYENLQKTGVVVDEKRASS